MMRLSEMVFPDGSSLVTLVDENGVAYVCNQALVAAFGTSPGRLGDIVADHAGRLNPLRFAKDVPNAIAAFAYANKTALGILRMRGDLILWSLRDAIRIAFWIRSDKAYQFQEAAIEHFANAAVERALSESEFFQRLQARVEQLEAEVRPALQTSASAFGRGLQAQRATKHIRLVK